MPPTADETLADEARRGKRAGFVAIAAGLLTLGSGAYQAVVFADQPTVPVLEALGERLSANPPAQGAKVREALFYNDHAASIIFASVLVALAVAAIGFTLAQIYLSVRARRPQLARGLVIAAIGGATCVAVGELTHALGLVIESHKLAGMANPTAAAARDVLRAPFAVAGIIVRELGVFALGISFVVLALNAMRVGLLTRFMGVLGIIVGALIIVRLGSTLPIVQTFWLCGVGAMFLGKWPPGLPPAWTTGEAQPWPTQQEIREQRMARKAELAGEPAPEPEPRRGRRRPEPPETPAPEAPARPAHPSSKKRKKKRR
ncbi:MAG TPA: hypothetical protein VL120_08455 [Solirubrobacteraceae bacterium]|nr:hypothetical protein [Solirubrobacteraceae bacterium]